MEKAGGHVLYWNGHRVMGILAMSRAIGDHGLRPYIIPDPEASVNKGGKAAARGTCGEHVGQHWHGFGLRCSA